jgi:hypothetical protein
MFSPAHNEPIAEGTGDTEMPVPDIDEEVLLGPASGGEDVVVEGGLSRLGDDVEGAAELILEGELESGAVLYKTSRVDTVFDDVVEGVFAPVKTDCPGVFEEPAACVTPEFEPGVEDPRRFEGKLFEDKAGETLC